MSAFKYLFTPKLFKDYSDGTSITTFYNEQGLEKLGGSLLSMWGIVFGIAKYGAPFITMYMYKKGFFAAEHLGQLIKLSTGITVLVLLSYCIRGYGRSQSEIYRKFIKELQEAKANPNDATSKKKIRGYDFEFDQWPIDWSIKTFTTKGNTSRAITPVRSERSNVNWISPCSVAAFIAIHTFGLRMIYPGSIGLIQKYLHQMLVQGRAKLIMQQNGVRNKVQAIDGNEIDTMFIDNRNSRFDNGKTLVIAAEGNAGFYEIGIMGTPVDLHFSVLGFNHPGFAGSSGEPFPSQDQNAVDALMQFAIESLGFKPENIMLFGWSIGGYSSLYLASQYPNIRGVVLDATFDDILYLALPRMPESLSSIVRIAIRDYCNLNNNDLITQYNGPVLMIRRTEDEVICTEDMVIGTNRGNNLLVHMLKYRFPNIFKPDQLTFAQKILNKTIDHSKSNEDQMSLSLILSYVSENGSAYPLKIGEDYSNEQRNSMAQYLIKNHFYDYKSSHCTPLPGDFFKNGWTIPAENDFVFT